MPFTGPHTFQCYILYIRNCLGPLSWLPEGLQDKVHIHKPAQSIRSSLHSFPDSLGCLPSSKV